MALVAIFAHPDDEAFGPAGTLAKFAKSEDVYVICVTNGNDKTRKYDKETADKGLSAIRNSELDASAKILGIKKVFYLGYEDGELNNNIYHKAADSIKEILDSIKPDKLMTYEMRGVSGHIDHIFVSMVTTYLFEKLTYLKKLYYCCLSKEGRGEIKDYFIYFPPGYEDHEVDEIVDVTDFWDKKVAAIYAHKSQLWEPFKVKKWIAELPKKENFFVLKK